MIPAPTVQFKGGPMTAQPVSPAIWEKAGHRICRWNSLPPDKAEWMILCFVCWCSLTIPEPVADGLVAMTDDELKETLDDYNRSIGIADQELMTRYVIQFANNPKRNGNP